MKWIIAVLFASLLFTSCDNNGGIDGNPQLDGVAGPTVTLLNGRVLVSIAFKDLKLDLGVTVPIPSYPNSSMQVGPDFESGGLLLSISIAVIDFLANQGRGLDNNSLPGGRPLPGVAEGSLPSIAVSLPELLNCILYFGPRVIGFFVPFSGIRLAGIILSFRFFDAIKNAIGTLSLVGADVNGENAGILVLMDPNLLGLRGDAAREEALKEYWQQGYR